MKRILSLLLLACLALGLLTGCQETPDTPAVIQKDQEQMLQTAEHGKDNSALLVALEVPERFTGDWTGVNNCVIVHADAEIMLPNADKIPTGSIGRRDFTQEDANNLMRVLLKGNTLYEELGMTKQQALERLEQLQAMQRGEIPVDLDGGYEALPGAIERWAEYARTAPDGDERAPAETSFVPRSENLYAIRGWSEVDGKTMHLFIQNVSGFLDHASVFVDGYGDSNFSSAVAISLIQDELPEPLTVDFPLEDAIRQGDALMEELGFEHLVCDEAYPVLFTRSMPTAVAGEGSDNAPSEESWRSYILATGYELQYVRCVNGFPISWTPIRGGAVPENESFNGAWHYEVITLDYTKDGLVYFYWESPHTEPVLQVEDTQLMPFDQIADIFAKMIMVKNSDVQIANERNGFDTVRNYEITKVKLGLMRIKAKDSFDEGLLVPVWDFWGHSVWEWQGETTDFGEEILLTINAIDGSMIDRELGY